MKFIFTADWHIKLYSDKTYVSNGLPLRLHEIFSTINAMCNYAKENGIDTIIVGGDINDLKNVVHVRAFVILKKMLASFPEIQFFFLHGNHDSSSKGDLESAIQLLDGPDNIHTITKKLTVDDILFVPYSSHMIDDIIESEEGCVLIGHLGLSDAQLSSGLSLKTRLSSSDLRRFDLVLLGHYHKPQVIGNVYYVGSPIQLRKDEKDEEKRFLVVNTDNAEIEVKSILTEGYRKYIDLIITDKKEVNKTLKAAEQFKKEGHFVSIHNQTETAIKNSVDGVTIVEEYEEEHQIRGITTAMSVDGQMRKFLEIEGIPEEDRELYMQVGLETLNTFKEEEKDVLRDKNI
jgi:DNA repair exonuclease SbcCD nuclease subunit